LASAPRHPIFIDALHMIQRQTAVALEWLAERPLEIARLHAEGDDDAVRKLSEANMASEPKDGGPLGVMEWTGPGLWTDCVLRWGSPLPSLSSTLATTTHLPRCLGQQISTHQIWRPMARSPRARQSNTNRRRPRPTRHGVLTRRGSFQRQERVG
jgi:alpha 1,6-mannosyltransferase